MLSNILQFTVGSHDLSQAEKKSLFLQAEQFIFNQMFYSLDKLKLKLKTKNQNIFVGVNENLMTLNRGDKKT